MMGMLAVPCRRPDYLNVTGLDVEVNFVSRQLTTRPAMAYRPEGYSLGVRITRGIARMRSRSSEWRPPLLQILDCLVELSRSFVSNPGDRLLLLV
jgi:hypothetical protein